MTDRPILIAAELREIAALLQDATLALEDRAALSGAAEVLQQLGTTAGDSQTIDARLEEIENELLVLDEPEDAVRAKLFGMAQALRWLDAPETIDTPSQALYAAGRRPPRPISPLCH